MDIRASFRNCQRNATVTSLPRFDFLLVCLNRVHQTGIVWCLRNDVNRPCAGAVLEWAAIPRCSLKHFGSAVVVIPQVAHVNTCKPVGNQASLILGNFGWIYFDGYD